MGEMTREAEAIQLLKKLLKSDGESAYAEEYKMAIKMAIKSLEGQVTEDEVIKFCNDRGYSGFLLESIISVFNHFGIIKEKVKKWRIAWVAKQDGDGSGVTIHMTRQQISEWHNSCKMEYRFIQEIDEIEE